MTAEIKNLGRLAVSRDRVAMDRLEDVFPAGRRFRYCWMGVNELHLYERQDGYVVSDYDKKNVRLQLARSGQEPHSPIEWPPLRGPTPIKSISKKSSDPIDPIVIIVGSAEEGPRARQLRPRREKTQAELPLEEPAPPAAAPPTVPPLAVMSTDVADQVRMARDLLNAHKARLGDNMAMGVNADGQLRVRIMLDI